MHDPHKLPTSLPIPVDDGGAAHLIGADLPDVTLAGARRGPVRLRDVATEPTVFFFYPRTGVPGQPPNMGFDGEDWDDIPGARGCTPQSCAFRDAYGDISALGVQVFGVSTQTPAFQRGFMERNGIPFDYLSDSELVLVEAMRLPTFQFPVESGGPDRLIKRMAWFVRANRIEKVWYPVFPPDENAAQVLAWLRANGNLRGHGSV
jgi:peroxiredoxin